ncbi:MAG: hypothetical protein HY720_16660 [Planctomycetes bacterium]|nr:hypothetical protein [Planctomycetota bacterium]
MRTLRLALAALLFVPPLGAQDLEGTSIEARRGERKGVVIAAPHEGYEFGTARIAGTVAEALGTGLVVARNFRDPDARRWVNVNRPTECLYVGGAKGDEVRTERAEKVFQEYRSRVIEAAGLEEGPLEFYVEVHGAAEIETVEIATVGFEQGELARLAARAREAGLEVVFDLTRGERPFHFGAGGARELGSLRPEAVRHALHVELPPALRERGRRDETARLLSELARSALEEARR